MTQPATRPCECGSTATVTPTSSAWEFDVYCSHCGYKGLISFAHRDPPPTFDRTAQGELFQL